MSVEGNTLDVIRMNAMVQQALNFVASINDFYGADKGFEVWEDISARLGDDLKFELFKAMLSGRTAIPNSVTLKSVDNLRNRVATIKMVRQYSGMGLKEAKELTDVVSGYMGATQRVMTFVLLPGTDASTLKSDFNNLGADIEVY